MVVYGTANLVGSPWKAIFEYNCLDRRMVKVQGRPQNTINVQVVCCSGIHVAMFVFPDQPSMFTHLQSVLAVNRSCEQLYSLVQRFSNTPA